MQQLLSEIADICELLDYPADGDENLESEYVRLFINDFDAPLVSLYAASYLKGVPVQNVLEYLKRLFKSADLTVSPDARLRDDHIILCFEFLYLLIEAELDKKIIKNFSNNFIFSFLDVPGEIRDKTDNPYFLNIADKMDNFFTLLEKWLLEI